MNENYKSLEVSSFRELADKEFEPVVPLIDHFLPGEGVFLFCGKSKIGKSWLALDIGVHVCNGIQFWKYDTNCKEVLYLCLEDGERRLQERMFTIADNYSVAFHYCTESTTIDTDLMKQLEEQVTLSPGIGLIIIDTLAAIRGDISAYGGNPYLKDYNIIRSLHEFALNHHLAILLIHHVRKLSSQDPFDDISGTNGLYGAADGAFIMRSESDGVKLYFKNRDMEQQILTLEFDGNTCTWKLLDESSPVESVFKSDPDLRKALEYIKEHGEFFGTAQEFCNRINASKKPQSISGKLQNRKRDLEKMGILFVKTKKNDGMHFEIIDLNSIKDPSEFTEDDLPYEIVDDE